MAWKPIAIPAQPDPTPSVVAVTHAGTPLLVVRFDGDWYAIEDRCTHAGCAFSTDGEVDGALVICDCHGSEFDVRSGAVVRGPARVPIPTFAVRETDGRLEVDV